MIRYVKIILNNEDYYYENIEVKNSINDTCGLNIEQQIGIIIKNGYYKYDGCNLERVIPPCQIREIRIIV